MAGKKKQQQPLVFGMEIVHEGVDVVLIAMRGGPKGDKWNALIRRVGLWELSDAAAERATRWYPNHPGFDPTITDAQRWLDDDCVMLKPSNNPL